MNSNIIYIIIGGLIGFLSSIITTMVNTYLQYRIKVKQWEHEKELKKEEILKEEQTIISNIVANSQLSNIDRGEKNIHETILKPTRWYAASCVAEGTLVTMYDKTKKLIENLVVGDEILVYDDKRMSYEGNKILDVISSKVPRCILINDELLLSESQEIITTEGSFRDRKIKLGTHIIREEGGTRPIDKIELLNKPIKVYGLVLETQKGFFAQGYYVLDYKSKVNYQISNGEQVGITENGEIVTITENEEE